MLNREEWLPLARKLDWDYSYVREDEVFPDLRSQWNHPHRAAIKEFHTIHVRSADQPPIQSVGPPVILAAQDILAAAA